MKKAMVIWGTVMIALLVSACAAPATRPADAKTVLFNSPYVMTASEDRVEEFMELKADYETYYEDVKCVNITPDFVADNSSFTVFKYEQSCNSFLLFEDKIYSIGAGFGGLGLTSMALADMNKDGQYELYYTFSWGSGLHRSQVGYFDPGTKAEHGFEDSYIGEDVVLTADDKGALIVNIAEVSASESFVDMTLTPMAPVSTITLTDDGISLVPIS